jgi:RimJ/RimL family protein N-acetyltransferase
MNPKDQYLLKDIPEQIQTEHTTIRRYQKGDGTAIYKLAQRNNNRQHLKGTADDITGLKSVEEAEVKARKHRAEWTKRDRFVAGVWDEDKYIGEIWIEPAGWDIPCFEIGWFIDKGREGEGLAYEAANACLEFIFNELEAHKVIAKTSDTNTRSMKLAERLGFKEEGHLRENEIKDGKRSGTLLYGLLREER